MLLKLMNEWRLMDELAVLRDIYLLGSGICLLYFMLFSIKYIVPQYFLLSLYVG